MSMKKFVKNFFCRFLFKVSYSGLENLQKYDQYLICPNHSCIFDPFFIYPVSRNLYIMAKAEIFKYPIFSWNSINWFLLSIKRLPLKEYRHKDSIYLKNIFSIFFIIKRFLIIFY